MNDPRRSPAHLWLRPVAVWVALVLLAVLSLDAAYLPRHAFGTLASLAIAATMVILLWLFLMDLIGSAALVRLIAAAGLLWLSFMFALTFSDYLSRRCEASDGGYSRSCAIQSPGRRTF